jgi:aminoglycoside N3'-acetyltransferase
VISKEQTIANLSLAIEYACRDQKSTLNILFSSLGHLRLNRDEYAYLAKAMRDRANESESSFLLPAYTYSSRRGLKFSTSLPPDPQVGALSRVAFEDTQYSSRSFDPDFSYLIVGRPTGTEERHFTRSFGEGSSHEAILGNANVNVILMGPVLNTGLTLAMHLEAKHKVPWRQFITTRHKCYFMECSSFHEYFARIDDGHHGYQPSRSCLLEPIIKLPGSRSFLSGVANTVIFNWKEFADWFETRLKHDIYFQARSL